MKCLLVIVSLLLFCGNSYAQHSSLIPVSKGWAKNTVNTVVFRKNALVTFKDTQFIAFYNEEQYVVLAKRRSGSGKWQIKQTPYKGNTNDAHNCISIMIDGAGYLHLAWDHHNNQLNYCKSVAPGSLELSEPLSMTGQQEQAVSYPEFYKMRNGNLIFMYRNGGSGRGNLVIDQYDIITGKWKQLQTDLIDGEGKRNAYWQAFIDANGTIHVSWVWRENPDVASNHDLCYARSNDGGISWERSNGVKYQLPITEKTAEYLCHIPQRSDLINQTSMYADESGKVFIASYWKDKEDTVPQYHIVYLKEGSWKIQKLHLIEKPFSLSGMGSKQIPISRPQIVKWKASTKDQVALIYRSEQRGNKLSMAVSDDLEKQQWHIYDLSDFSTGSSEPLYDTELWKQKKQLDFFIQYTEQKDSEGKTNLEAQMVQVLQYRL